MSRRLCGLFVGLFLIGVLLWLALPAVHRHFVLNPALVAAVKRQDEAAMARLLRLGADANVSLSRGEEVFPAPSTPLMYACEWMDVSAVKTLIAAGAEVNATDKRGATALMLAAAQAKPAVVKELLRAGARPELRDSSGQTALRWCAARHTWSNEPGVEERRAETTLILLKATGKREPGELEAMLREAEEAPSPGAVRVLRQAGVRGLREELLQIPGGALLYAVRTRDMKLLKRLVREGADMHVVDGEGRTPLICAAQLWDAAVIRYLLAHAKGMDAAVLNAQDHEGSTALIHAARMAYEDSVFALLRAGVNVNLVDEHGCSALHYAALAGADASVAALIRAGANVNTRNRKGKTPLDAAGEYPHRTTMALLKRNGARD